MESQCVRDEEGRLLRDKGRIRERWVRFFRSLLSAKSDMLDPDIPKRLPQQPVVSALGIKPKEEEIATAIKAMANAKAVGPDGLPAEDRTILLVLHQGHPHLAQGESPTAVERRGISLVSYAGKVILKVVTRRLSAYCELMGRLPEEQCGFRPDRSTTDTMFVVRRLQETGRKARVSLFMRFTDLQKAYATDDRTLLWQVLASKYHRR